MKLTLLTLAACVILGSCLQKKDCPGFDGNISKINTYSAGSKLVYSNGNTDIIFTIASASIDPPETKECKGPMLMQSCEDTRCTAHGKIEGTGDVMRQGKFNRYVLDAYTDNKDGSDDLRFSGTVLDLGFGGDYYPLNGSLKDDSIIAQLQAFGRTHDSVLVMHCDTLSKFYSKYSVWRIFFTRQDGIIGFSDRETHSDFFLKLKL